jgi:Tfp pilus assembly protein PilN
MRSPRDRIGDLIDVVGRWRRQERISAMKRSMAVVGAFLFAATTAMTFSQSARAETGLLWLDSIYAAPAGQVHSMTHKRHHRVVDRVVGASYAPRAVYVAAVTSVGAGCFWCNARVSGLGF